VFLLESWHRQNPVLACTTNVWWSKKPINFERERYKAYLDGLAILLAPELLIPKLFQQRGNYLRSQAIYSHTKLRVLFDNDIVGKRYNVKTIRLDQTMTKISAR
jgi:hypothetical protein